MSAAVPKPSPSGAHKPFTFTSPRLIQQYQKKWYPKIVWFFVGGAIALLTLTNIVYILRVRARRRALAKTISSPTAGGESVRPGSGTRPALRNVPRAIGTLFKIVAFRWTLPYGLNYVISVSELAISCAYLGILLTWSFIKSHNLTPAYWNQRVATIAWWQLPLLPLLSGKNNLIGYVTGIGHEKINIIHRAVARSIFILTLCHTFNKLKGFPRENLAMKKYKTGLMAMCAFAAIFLFSLRPIRTHAFEFFLILHVCLISITIAGLYFHQPEDALALWLLIGFWLFDRAVRLFRMLSINQGKPRCTEAIVEAITPKAIRLTVPNRDIKWKAGQHVYLTLPGVSTVPFESHPFTIANIPSGQGHSDLVFFIRAMDGFTRKLDEYAQAHDGQSVTAVVDGPYGRPPPVNTFSTVVLMAGGSGVSFTLPLLLDVVAAARRKQTPVKRVVFIWSLRSAGEVKWASDVLNDIHNNPPSGLSVDIRVHVTRTSSLVASLENTESEKTDSAMDSPSSDKTSEENIKGEKGEKGPRTIITETVADEAISHDGHSPNTIGTFKTVLGRCAIQAIIEEEIEASFGPVLVTGCGPIGLTKSIRSALRKGAAGPLSVLRGGQPVTMYIENFGALRS